MFEKQARIIPFINDTEDQEVKLNAFKEDFKKTLVEEKDVEKAAKQKLSDWGLLQFKIQAMIFPQIVFSDSFLLNNSFFHELSDVKFEEFVTYAAKYGAIEARCRRNAESGIFESVKGFFVRKDPPIRAYWSKKLQGNLGEAGEKIADAIIDKNYKLSPCKISGIEYITANSYVEALKQCYSDKESSEFNEYCQKIARFDVLFETLGENKLVLPWRENLTHGILADSRESILAELTNLKTKNKLINVREKDLRELEDKIRTAKGYEGQWFKDLFARIDSKEANIFFHRYLHKPVFCKGLAEQHLCGNMQTREIDTMNKEKVRLVMDSTQRDKLRELSWKDFFEGCQKIDREKLLVAMTGDNHSPNLSNKIFQDNLDDLFEIKCGESEQLMAGEEENSTQIDTTTGESVLCTFEDNEVLTITFN
jgi:hypothetical protein